MRLFLDTSVQIAALVSAVGASRLIFNIAQLNRWELKTSNYVESELRRHLPQRSPEAQALWPSLRERLVRASDVVVSRWPSVFPVRKDRPVLFTAAACADVLLTHDRGDFIALLGSSFYALAILTPGAFVERERLAGRLVMP